MRKVPLDVARSAQFDANGETRLQIGPTVYGHSWNVKRMVTTSDSTTEVECRVYLHGEAPNALIAGSYAGRQDFNETDITLQSLDKLVVVWSQGEPDKFATIQLQGTVADVRL